MLVFPRMSRAARAACLVAGFSMPALAAPLAPQGLPPSAAIPHALSTGHAAPPLAAFEGALPARTVFWVGAEDVRELRAHLCGSPIGRMFRDPALVPLLDALTTHVGTWRAQLRAAAGADPMDLLDMLSGPAALAVILPEHGPGSDAEGKVAELSVTVVLLADVGTHRAEAASLMGQLVARLGERDAGLVRGVRAASGVELVTLTQWPSAEPAAGEDRSAEGSAAPESADASGDAAGAGEAGDEDATDDPDALGGWTESEETVTPGRTAPGVRSDSAASVSDGLPDGVLSYGFRDSLLVAAFDWQPGAHSALDDVLAGLDGQAAVPSLASRADFTGSEAAHAGDLRCWTDVGGLARLLVEREGAGHADDAHKLYVIRSLGLQDLGALAQSMRWHETGSEWSAGLGWTGNGWIPRLLRLLCRPGDARTLDLVPTSCRSATVAHVDLAGLFDASIGMLLDLQAASPSEVTEVLADVGSTLGFGLRDDLLELFDGEFAFTAVVTEREDAFPGTVSDPQNFGLIAGLEDGAALRELIDAAVEGSGLRAARQRENFDGQVIDHITLLPQFALHYAILDDVLLASPSSAVLHELLARRLHPGQPGLPSLPGFAQTLAQLPEPHGLLSYADTAAQIEGALNTLKFLPELLVGTRDNLRKEGARVDFLDGLDWLSALPMPDPAIVRRYLAGPTMTAIAVDDEGVHIRSVGP